MNKSRLAMIGASAVAAVGVGFGLISPAGAVDSYSPPGTVELGGTAVVDARGAVVTVPVTVVCGAGQYAYLGVQVTQRVNGGAVADAGASTYFECTGTLQRLDLTATARDNAFKQGTAYGQATLYWAGAQLTDAHTISLVK